MKKVHYFAIEGVIGAGKTTLAKLLTERLEANLVLENPEENPYLEDFYRDPKRYAFQLQIFFLLNRYRQLVTLPQQDLFHQYLIADYLFAKDKIFASLNLEERDWVLYQRVATLLEKELKRPDLVIYLQSSTERLLANIKQRDRGYEKAISEDYIRALNEAYNRYFFRYDETPLLVINASETDFVKNKEDLEDLIYWIENPPAGVKYYVPQKR
jgi:deoxyguanosine kinase